MIEGRPVRVALPDAKVICDVRGPGKEFGCPSQSTAANARLIAAAPELLEALEAIANDAHSWLEGDMDMPAGDLFQAIYNAARAAIAKATE